jgi:hypothetical protein
VRQLISVGHTHKTHAKQAAQQHKAWRDVTVSATCASHVAATCRRSAPLVVNAGSQQEGGKQLQATNFGRIPRQRRRYDDFDNARCGCAVALQAPSAATLRSDERRRDIV